MRWDLADSGVSCVIVLALVLCALLRVRHVRSRSPALLFATDVIAVVGTSSCGLGMIARRNVARGEVLWEEEPLAILTIDDVAVAADAALLALQSDAQTVLALAQMRSGAPPDPRDYSHIPGMKVFADRIVRYQAAHSFEALSPVRQRRWMDLCDSLALHGSGSVKTAAGVYHSNSFGQAAGGQRTSVLFEVLSRVNHSCAPNVDVVTEVHLERARGRLVALRDISAGDEVLVSYLGSVGSARMALPTEARRLDLRRKHRFICACERCGPVSADMRARHERDEREAVRRDVQVACEVAEYNAAGNGGR